jgi:hypothetical protein
MPKFNIQCAPPESKFKTNHVEGDGSCFFHSLYFCLSATEFKAMSSEERTTLVRKERIRLASLLKLSTFLKLAEGEVCTLMMEKQVLRYLKKALKKYKLDFKSVDFYTTYINNSAQGKNFLKAQSVDKCIIFPEYPRFDSKIKKIILKSQEEAFDTFVENLADPSYYIDNLYIQYLMESYKVNILFFTSNGAYYPTGNFEWMLQNGYPFIAFHYISEAHFEPIAEVKDNITKRYFLPSHPLISNLKDSR